MKGIVLAGGLGTRLYPLTKNDNKHLLPVFDKRMVELPMRSLISAGLKDIILITGGLNPGKFLEIFKNGASLGANRLYYAYQEGQGGIPEALKMARPFMSPGEPCVVILGDNYFENGITKELSGWTGKGCRVFLKETDTPNQFGIATLEEGKITAIQEKPENPQGNLAILGCYMFDGTLWDRMDKLAVSSRGETEILDVVQSYLNADKVDYFHYAGFWKDMGTFDSWMSVSERLSRSEDDKI